MYCLPNQSNAPPALITQGQSDVSPEIQVKSPTGEQPLPLSGVARRGWGRRLPRRADQLGLKSGAGEGRLHPLHLMLLLVFLLLPCPFLLFLLRCLLPILLCLLLLFLLLRLLFSSPFSSFISLLFVTELYLTKNTLTHAHAHTHVHTHARAHTFTKKCGSCYNQSDG